MSKLKGFGFADYEIVNRFKEETAYDKIDKIRIDKVLRSKYKKNKNVVGNRDLSIILCLEKFYNTKHVIILS